MGFSLIELFSVNETELSLSAMIEIDLTWV